MYYRRSIHYTKTHGPLEFIYVPWKYNYYRLYACLIALDKFFGRHVTNTLPSQSPAIIYLAFILLELQLFWTKSLSHKTVLTKVWGSHLQMLFIWQRISQLFWSSAASPGLSDLGVKADSSLPPPACSLRDYHKQHGLSGLIAVAVGQISQSYYYPI